ncbi:MAG TPA: NHL repeat-containing protein [Pirellulales bacterium]|jgi:hypothetical protein|nr:NHL repeat-containing protein [Pirellulales bacterium]
MSAHFSLRIARAAVLWFAASAALSATVARADLLVSDYTSGKILRYDQTTGAFLGVLADISQQSGGFAQAVGLQLGPDGRLWVSDQLNDKVLRYDLPSGAYHDTVISSDTAGPSDLQFSSDGNLYVANFNGGNPISQFSPTGAYLGSFTSGGIANGSPSGIFGPDGNLYVSDYQGGGGAQVIRYQGPSGATPGALLDGGNGFTDPAHPMQGPTGMLFLPNGNLLVDSNSNSLIFEFDPTGAYITNFSTGTATFPGSMLLGTDGSLWVAEEGAGGIYRYDLSAGNFGAPLGIFAFGGGLVVPSQMLLAAVPEPSTFVLGGLGLLGLALFWFARRPAVLRGVGTAKS